MAAGAKTEEAPSALVADGATEAVIAKTSGQKSKDGAKEDRQPHGRTMRGRRLTCPDFGGLFLAFRWINLPPATAATREAGNCDRNGLRHSRSLPSMRVQRFTKRMEIDAMLSAC